MSEGFILIDVIAFHGISILRLCERLQCASLGKDDAIDRNPARGRHKNAETGEL